MHEVSQAHWGLTAIIKFSGRQAAKGIDYLLRIEIYYPHLNLLKHDHSVVSDKYAIINIGFNGVGRSLSIWISIASNRRICITITAVTTITSTTHAIIKKTYPTFQHLISQHYSHQHCHYHIQHYQRHHHIRFTKPFP
jgi:hypothetical protein